MDERPPCRGAMLLASLAALSCLVSAAAEAADSVRLRARETTAPEANGCLSAVVATAGGSTTVCPSCTGGTVTESHDGKVAAALQWGFRSAPGAHIAAIPGETGASYLIRGSDFPGLGTYRLVVIATPSCGPTVISNEIVVTVATQTAPGSVRYLTVTSKDQRNVLNWLNPPASDNVTIRYHEGPEGCLFPSQPLGGDGSLLAAVVPADAGKPMSFTHDRLVNGHKYCYTLWVDERDEFSTAQSNSGRPFSTAGLVKWAFNLGIFSMVSPGNGSGVVHMVANDNSLHSVVKGDGPTGGEWPTSWTPRSMAGPSQGRPSGVNVTIGTARPAIVLSSQDGHVYVFDAETGAPGWSPSSPLLGPSVVAHPSGVFTDFGGTRDLIFVGSRDATGSRFHALRLSDGAFASPGWAIDGGVFGKIGPISGQAAVDQDKRRVYFASRAFDAFLNPNTVWCVDLETGAEDWAAPIGDVDTGVTVFGDRLYVGTNSGEVKAIDTSRGHEGNTAWSFPIPALEGNVKGYVAVDRITGDAFFSTTARLWALKADGTPRWTPAYRELPSPSTPVFAPQDSWVYVGGGDGLLHRFAVSTGEEDLIAPFPIDLSEGGGVGSPTFDLVAGFVYVGTEAGLVYAVRLP
jgi:outer membrane protein assembly factor BamB